MKRRIISLLCVLALFAGLVALTGHSAAAQPYFMAVNDQMLDLKGETMPVYIERKLYAPYFLFDSNSSGADLGTYATYGRDSLAIYSRNKGGIVFDLAENTVTSTLEESVDHIPGAVVRSSIPFVPVEAVCAYFGLDWSLTAVKDYGYGYLLRVCSAAAILSDKDFVAAARYRMNPMYQEYVKEQGAVDPLPSQPVESAPLPEGGVVYLAFRVESETTGGLEAIQAGLERYGVRALFFFRPEELARRDDHIRALAAAGHKIGLMLEGDAGQMAEQGRQANRLLAHIVYSGSCIMLADGAETPEGWFGWQSDVVVDSARSYSRQVRDVMNAMEGGGDCFALLDDSVRTAQTVEQLLRSLRTAGSTVRLATEPVLQ